HRGAEPPGYRPVPQISRRGAWGLRCAPHLGPTTAAPSPSPLCPARRGDSAGWCTVGAMSSPLLLARSCPLASLPAPLPRRPCAALWPGPIDLHGALSGTCRAPILAAAPRGATRHGVGGLCQRAPPGAPAHPHLLGALYASRRHLEPSARSLRRRPGDLSIQRLPECPPPADPDATLP